MNKKNIFLISLNIIMLLLSNLLCLASSSNYIETRTIALLFLIAALFLIIKIKINNKLMKTTFFLFNYLLTIHVAYYIILTIYYDM